MNNGSLGYVNGTRNEQEVKLVLSLKYLYTALYTTLFSIFYKTGNTEIGR